MKKGLKLLLFVLMIAGAVLAVIGLIGTFKYSVDNSEMIVKYYIHGVIARRSRSYIFLGAGVGAIALGAVILLVSFIKKKSKANKIKNVRREDEKNFSDYAKDSLNPEKTRVRFEQLRRNNPALNGLVERCLTQMDSMDVFQARQKSLLDANEAIYLEDTIEVLDNSERRMCRNFRNVINCCILIEDTKKGEEALDRDIIETSLADNEDELESVNTLLKYSVAYINNYNRNGVSDRSELDAWLKVMKKSMGGNNE